MTVEARQVRGAGDWSVCLAGLALLTVFGSVGCSGDVQTGRVFAEVEFDTAFVFGSPEDSVLLRPSALRRWRDGVVAFDPDASRVTTFDGEGNPQWIFHRPGRGPAELTIPLDGFAQDDGTLFVLDAGNQRLVTLTSDGHFGSLVLSLESVPFRVMGVAPVSSSEVLLLGGHMRGAFLDLDSLELVDELELEPSAPVPPRFRGDMTVDTDPESGVWVVAMRFGPDWWTGGPGRRFTLRSLIHEADHATAGGSQELAEGVRVAAGAPPSRHGVYSLSVQEAGVSVLTGGGWAGGGEQNDIVDLYDPSGAYRHSLRLPGPARDHLWHGDRLFLLRLSPYPALVALDLRAP